MSAHVLLNLLTSWGEIQNVRLAKHFISFAVSLTNPIIQMKRMLDSDSFYQMT